MKQLATRALWAKQSLLLGWAREGDTDYEFIQLAGRELMRRTDTTVGRRARAAREQDERRLASRKGRNPDDTTIRL